MALAENLPRLRQRIAAAAERAHRDPASIQLLAVSKNQPPAQIQAAVDLGLTLFGENRVQEAKSKIGQCSPRLHWHMIGHLQSNKCRDAVHFFEMIESVDSLPLAEELNRWAEKSGKTVPILLETNLAGETSKFGFRSDTVLNQLLKINALPKLEVHGLMTVAPWTPAPERVRPIFRQLAELRKQCEQKLGAPLPLLSMGMSGDFEIAIEEGATLLRIGTALFGPRPRNRPYSAEMPAQI